MELKLVQVSPPTKEEQDACEHDFTKAYFHMRGEVAEYCKKCKLSLKAREMTDEEAKEAYDNF